MGSPALAIVPPVPPRRPRAPVEWRNLGNLLQQIAAEGDQGYLDALAVQVASHLELLRAAKALSDHHE